MKKEVQRIVTPGGDVMIVMTLAYFEQLSAAASTFPCFDAEAVAGENGGGSDQFGNIPETVQKALAAGQSPLAAWRCFRKMSKNALARASGVSRFTIMRIEAAGPGAGNPKSRGLLAAALGISVSRI